MFNPPIALTDEELDEYQVDSLYDLYSEYAEWFNTGGILLHGSNWIVDVPRTDCNNPNLTYDFGFGFYATSIDEQAEKWALRKAEASDEPDDGPVVSVYLFDPSHLSVYEFENTDEEWLNFVCECRRDRRLQHNNKDLIIGRVADDDVISTVRKYNAGTITKEEALSELRFVKDNDQYLFTNNQACNTALHFVGWYYAD